MDPAVAVRAPETGRDGDGTASRSGDVGGDTRTRLLVFACVAVLTAPLLVALAALHSPR